MISVCPLYGGGAGARNEGHPGLFYDKFLNQWQRDKKGVWSIASKQDWVEGITPGPVGDAELLKEYCRRLEDLVTARGGKRWVYKTEGRFVTGTGRSHPIEIGFAWHPSLGVPYLPASSIKGLIGSQNREDVLGSEIRVGRVICLDAVPVAPVRLEADVITPHYFPWSEDNPPADWRSPTPIPFLTVAPGALFLFAVIPCERNAADAVAQVGRWLEDTLGNAGAGAKTAVGYGRMKRATGADVAWLAELNRRAEQVREARLQEQQRAKLDPLDRELQEVADSSKDPNIKPWILWLKELEAGRWADAAQAHAVAERIRAAMQLDGRWRRETHKKNPAKDRDYQNTLIVLKYLSANQ
jgi:CRISPR-associated protein Cmr6